MKKTVILTTTEKKGMFVPPYERSEHGNLSVISVKENTRALKKLSKSLDAENVIISHTMVNRKIFADIIYPYNDFSLQTILPVLEKICRQTASKYSMSIPFGEIYIMACPQISCSIISAVRSLSRIFTVISEEETPGKMYDELYFKHGTLIRHLPEFNSNICEDAIIIRCDGEKLPTWARLPVIDMCPHPACASRIVRVSDVYIADEKITGIQKYWEGDSGAALYSLMNEYPSAQAAVNINKRADKIFLLDTAKI